MIIQLIRNATLRINYAGQIILVDPFFAPKHSRDPFVGKERNPTVDLPLSTEAIMQDVELLIVSHLHSDHFDTIAQAILPEDWQLICQPGDEDSISGKGFKNVTPLETGITWNGIQITRTPGEHGSGIWKERMGNVMGFILQAEGEPTLYWTGDTILADSVRESIAEYQPQIIVTHSCGAQFEENSPIVMDAEQTIELCQQNPDTTIVAVHMDALDHATVSRADLRQKADEAGVSQEQLLIPADGDSLEF